MWLKSVLVYFFKPYSWISSSRHWHHDWPPTTVWVGLVWVCLWFCIILEFVYVPNRIWGSPMIRPSNMSVMPCSGGGAKRLKLHAWDSERKMTLCEWAPCSLVDHVWQMWAGSRMKSLILQVANHRSNRPRGSMSASRKVLVWMFKEKHICWELCWFKCRQLWMFLLLEFFWNRFLRKYMCPTLRQLPSFFS